MDDKITNIRLAGLGGMGVLKAALVLSEILFELGYDVKKAEVHGMSQRGGSISSDIRFGKKVFSPMIPKGKIDILLSMMPEWSDDYIPEVVVGGLVIKPEDFDVSKLASAKAVNVAMLGVLSKHLTSIPVEKWLEALKKFFPEKLWKANEDAFMLGRNSK